MVHPLLRVHPVVPFPAVGRHLLQLGRAKASQLLVRRAKASQLLARVLFSRFFLPLRKGGAPPLRIGFGFGLD